MAVHPNDEEAYVTNGISGTVSVVSLKQFRVVATIPVGTEPRGCALTPNGLLLYVANHTEGTVSIINTALAQPDRREPCTVGRNPTAIAITNDGDGDDADETVFVTQIFAELDPNFVDPSSTAMVRRAISGSEGSSTPSRRAMPIRRSPKSPSPRSPIPALPPTASNFCPKAPARPAHSLIFCPDPN